MAQGPLGQLRKSVIPDSLCEVAEKIAPHRVLPAAVQFFESGLEAVQRDHAAGRLYSLRADAGLSAAAKRAFRSWREAVLAAGLKEQTG